MDSSPEEELTEESLNLLLGVKKSGRSKKRREKAKAKRDIAPPPKVATSRTAQTTAVSIEYADVPVDGALSCYDTKNSNDQVITGLLTAFRRAQGISTDGASGPESESKNEGDKAGGEGHQGEDASGENDILGGLASHIPGGIDRRQRRRFLQDFVAELKTLVPNPDVVEAHDVTSPDPFLLVHLKSLKNTVPVPRHWCHQKAYLQGKVRATPRPAYELPDYVAATGIGTLRDMDNEANDKKNLKAKTRERVRPKMGRIEVDYFVLRDAFYVHQTKPPLTGFGELYFEGKEFEKDRRGAKVGVLSERLKEALGMNGVGGVAKGGVDVPPPWLHAQQRFGPPLSYPNLNIPGLISPIPPGAMFGAGPGQWGFPPCNELGIPLYGDVFGAGGGGGGAGGRDSVALAQEALARDGHWGDVREGTFKSSSTAAVAATAEANALVLEEAAAPPLPPPLTTESETGTVGEQGATTFNQPTTTAAILSSAMAGAGGTLELRKMVAGKLHTTTQDSAAAAAPLYTVLQETTTALSGSLLASKSKYVLPGGGGGDTAAAAASCKEGDGVILGLLPEELGKLTKEELAARYEAEKQKSSSNLKGGAATDIAELMEEQEKKRRRKEESGGVAKKKTSKTDFKF